MITQEFWVYLVWGIPNANICYMYSTTRYQTRSIRQRWEGGRLFFLATNIFFKHIGNWTIMDLPPSSTFWGSFKKIKNWSENQERCSEIALQIFALTLYQHPLPYPGIRIFTNLAVIYLFFFLLVKKFWMSLPPPLPFQKDASCLAVQLRQASTFIVDFIEKYRFLFFNSIK